MGNRDNKMRSAFEEARDKAYGPAQGVVGDCAKAKLLSRKEELIRELKGEEEHEQLRRDGDRLLANLHDAHCVMQDQLSDALYDWFKHQGFWPANWDPRDANGELRYTQPEGGEERLITIPFTEYVRLKKMEKLGLVVTEVAEAMEAVRKDDYENEREEIADIEVRLHDYKGGFGLTRKHAAFTETAAESFFSKMLKNFARPFRHGKKF